MRKFLAILALLPSLAFAQIWGGYYYNPASVSITGGTIDGTTIGGTTPGAVSATSINAPSWATDTVSIGKSSSYLTIGTGGVQTASDHYLGFTATASSLGSADTTLFRDIANTLALRNGLIAQSFRAYNTRTDAANYEFGTFDFTTTANTLTIGTQKAGTGLSRNISIVVGGSAVATFTASGMNLNSGGQISVGLFQYLNRTFAALGTCNAGSQGATAFITDSTVAYTGANIGTAVAGSGTNYAKVYCDAVSWKVGG